MAGADRRRPGAHSVYPIRLHPLQPGDLDQQPRAVDGDALLAMPASRARGSHQLSDGHFGGAATFRAGQ